MYRIAISAVKRLITFRFENHRLIQRVAWQFVASSKHSSWPQRGGGGDLSSSQQKARMCTRGESSLKRLEGTSRELRSRKIFVIFAPKTLVWLSGTKPFGAGWIILDVWQRTPSLSAQNFAIAVSVSLIGPFLLKDLVAKFCQIPRSCT